MESLLCTVDQTKPSSSKSCHIGAMIKKKQKKLKPSSLQHPLKVVYISNPVRFKVTASEFRALVQELTGQVSDLPHPLEQSNKEEEEEEEGGSSIAHCLQELLQYHPHNKGGAVEGVSMEEEEVQATTAMEDNGIVDQFGLIDDDVFRPLENLSEFFPSGFLII